MHFNLTKMEPTNGKSSKTSDSVRVRFFSHPKAPGTRRGQPLTFSLGCQDNLAALDSRLESLLANLDKMVTNEVREEQILGSFIDVMSEKKNSDKDAGILNMACVT